MDPAIATAYVLGGFGALGSTLKIIEKFVPEKSDSPKLELDRDAQVNAEVWRYVEELRQERAALKAEHLLDKAGWRAELEEARKTVAVMRTDHEALQGMYRGSLDRIELLEMAKERDQSMILELQDKVRQLEAATS